MLMLLLYAGEHRYALECSSVIEVIPIVHLKKIRHVPDYVLGVMSFRGSAVPVIDFCKLVHGEPCSLRLHTRIILLRLEGFENSFIGLMAEKVIQTIKCTKESFLDSGFRIKDLPFLGGILTDELGSVQEILPRKFFQSMDELFNHKEENS